MITLCNCHENYSKALTYSELADAFDELSGFTRKARTLSMAAVLAWAEKHPEHFYVHPTRGTFHRIKGGE